MVFVNNSERYPRAGASTSTDIQPGEFATHPGMYRSRPAPQRQDGDIRFGEVEVELIDCVFCSKVPSHLAMLHLAE